MAVEEKPIEAQKPVQIYQAAKPEILNVVLNLKADDKGESATLDSLYTKPGNLGKKDAEVPTNQHRIRLIWKSEDGTKKIYQWMIHPLFLKFDVPASTGQEAETITTNGGEIVIIAKVQKQPWMHFLSIESYPPESAGKELGQFIIN